MMARALILLVLSFVPPAFADELHNALAGSASPYLAMHAEDPVAWQPWSANILERARREQRLILVSSGFFACHWCHVLQQESFRAPAFAELVNRHFLPVKVDREAMPALDAELRRAMQAITGRAGWPLNMILTPEGDPLYGFIYAPRDILLARLGRLHAHWIRTPQQLHRLARQATAELTPAPEACIELPPAKARATLIDALMQDADPLAGGFGQGTKFPHAPRLLAMLRLLGQAPDTELATHLGLTLDTMARSSVRDQLGGGFFRYTVDPSWQHPHFEQMLVDQALLARAYLQAGAALQRLDLRAIGRQLVEVILRDFNHPMGGHVAAQSALDRGGHEGGGYLWTDEALQAALPEALLKQATNWSWARHDDWVGGRLPTRLPDTPESHAARDRLLAARPRPVHPRDEQRPPAANGLVLSALVEACHTGHQPACKAAKLQASFLLDLDGAALPALQDRVSVAEGLLEWGAAHDDPKALRHARVLLENARVRFLGTAGWTPSEQALPPWSGGRPAMPDDEYPSASARWPELARRAGIQSSMPCQSTRGVLDHPLQHATALSLRAIRP